MKNTPGRAPNRSVRTILSHAKATVSWWFPSLLLVIFHAPGIFFRQLRVDPAYAWSLSDPSAQPLGSFNQDMVQGAYPYWVFGKWLRDSGLSWEWNPYMFAGVPLWPEGSFPLGGLSALLSTPFAADISFSLQPLFMGLLTVIFGNLILRELGLGAWARVASIALLLFARAPLALMQVPWHEIHIWLLVGIYILLRVWKAENLKTCFAWGLAGGAVIGWSNYGSHVQFTLLSGFPYLAVVAFSLSLITPGGRLRKPNLTVLTAGAILCVGAVLVGSGAWLPTLELAEHSYRSLTPKSTFFPVTVPFMPFSIPYDEDLRMALERWFGFSSRYQALYAAIPSNRIPVLGWHIDGGYFSLTGYFLLALTVLEPRTRHQAAPLLLPLALIFGGYNGLALLTQIPVLKAAFLQIPLIESVNLGIMVARANILVWLSAGFGLLALARLYEAGLAGRYMIGWTVVVAFFVALAFRTAAVFRSFMETDLNGFLAGKASKFEPAVPALVQSQAQELLDRWSPMPWAMAACLVLVAVEIIILRGLRREHLRLPATLLLSASFAAGGWIDYSDKLSWSNSATLVPKVPALETIRAQKTPGRMIVVNSPVDRGVRVIRRHLAKAQSRRDLSLGMVVRLGRELPFMGGMSLLYRVEDIRGASSMNSRDYRLFVEAVREQPEGAPLYIPNMSSEFLHDLPVHARSYDLLNTRWVLSPRNLDTAGYVKRVDGPMKLYENTNAMPRAWFTGRLRVIADREKLLREMTRPSFDIREALLEVAPSVSGEKATRYGLVDQVITRLPDSSYAWKYRAQSLSSLFYDRVPAKTAEDRWAADPRATGSVEVTEYTLNKRTFEVASDGPGMLMISEVFYPGWQVRVNGAPRDLYRADFTLLAVPLETGRNVVELYYESTARKVGMWITLATLATTLAAALLLVLWRGTAPARP